MIAKYDIRDSKSRCPEVILTCSKPIMHSTLWQERLILQYLYFSRMTKFVGNITYS